MEKKSRNRGFTLVELLITVTVLAIIVAPFLATFVLASGNNLNASQKQDAANLAEDIAEEIKGKSLKKLESEYGEPDESTGEFQFTVSNDDLPDGINKGFSAVVNLKPSSSSINDAIPTLTDMKTDNMKLFMKAFYVNDDKEKGLGAQYRKSIITVKYDEKKSKYCVSLAIEYFDSENKGHGLNIISESEYEDKPSVFVVYTPMHAFDTLYLNNELAETDMEDDEGDIVPVDFYLSVQNPDAGVIFDKNLNIYVEDEGLTSDENIRTYVTMREQKYTKIHTNSNIEGYNSSLVSNVKENRLYDLSVEVYYKGKKCTKFDSSKLNLG